MLMLGIGMSLEELHLTAGTMLQLVCFTTWDNKFMLAMDILMDADDADAPRHWHLNGQDASAFMMVEDDREVNGAGLVAAFIDACCTYALFTITYPLAMTMDNTDCWLGLQFALGSKQCRLALSASVGAISKPRTNAQWRSLHRDIIRSTLDVPALEWVEDHPLTPLLDLEALD